MRVRACDEAREEAGRGKSQAADGGGGAIWLWRTGGAARVRGGTVVPRQLQEDEDDTDGAQRKGRLEGTHT